MTALADGWYAVAQSRQLRARPLRRFLGGTPLVLWRTPDGVAALKDLCPHRGAPLSEGRVVDGAVACPYHGWRFDGGGACVATPALAGRALKAPAQALPAAEQDGLVFVRLGKAASPRPAFAPLMAGPHRVLAMREEVETRLADIVENILDTTHTSVLHQGYLRRAAGLPVRPRLAAGPDWIEAHYPPAATPSGLIGRLIGGPRYRIVDRFKAPAQAEVEYWEGETQAFALRFYLTPSSPGRVAIFARMAVPSSVLAPLKLLALRAGLLHIFRQDIHILQAVARNRALFDETRIIHAPQDLLRPGIESILRGEAPDISREPPELVV